MTKSELKQRIHLLNEINLHLEQCLKSCENAVQYHEKEKLKAFEIIGRLTVEKELECEEQ